jgi:hypothetical protein
MGHESTGKLRMITTDEMVDALTRANTSGENPLHQHVFREALRALVRLAKSEKLWEIKYDTALAVGLNPKKVQSPPHN